ncbi:MAG: aspartyl/asparaginyl beta-hydroxylase domain-containing protein [Proteobacteria bacterium]|nr:aspartyl/asparaginyl beta-hydroxylase domain-containing protein [Pseudomonadota bacterium]
MQPTPENAQALARAGQDALRRGDASGARELFSRAVAGGRADSNAWFGLAMACRALNDDSGKVAALDRALEIDPRNMRALMLKADHFANSGDNRAAASFYRMVLRVAPPPAQLPPDLAQDVRRAQAMSDQYAGEYASFLREHLSKKGFDEKHSSSRFTQSLDLMLGKKRLYLQEPRVYYFPELPQIQFYDRKTFPWLDAVEAATADIRVELLEVLKIGNAFSPYVESNSARPMLDDHGMAGNPNWGAFYLHKDGMIVTENAARCPNTLAALKDAPLANIKHRTPSIMFSMLRPGARIPSHNGFINARLICHLPLIVPGKCGFRVGNDVREWEEGKAWVFDDTVQHEAWNDSDKIRVILLFDIWRPELSEEERSLVSAMFEVIDSYGQKQPAWEM